MTALKTAATKQAPSTRTRRRVAPSHLGHLEKLTAILRENLEKCAADPDVDPVHDLRTGTRRVQAMVEALLREHPQTGEEVSPLHQAAEKWLRVLKKIRRAAAPVRDLDVHRKILKKLVKFGPDDKSADPAVPQPDVADAPAMALPTSDVEKQGKQLDDWLHHARQHQVAGLKKNAAKALAKFDKEAAAFAEAVHSAPRARRPRSAAVVALEAFVVLSEQMRHLDPENLHDFRKGAKKARYIAESADAEDAQATAVGKALKKLQDEIGDWHDWLMLADEARTALGDEGELIALIDAERDKHYALSMKTVTRQRGRLLGEWVAASQTQSRRAVRKTAPTISQNARKDVASAS